MAQVDYRNVAKSYGTMKVMEDISFTIPDGKFVVLLGPSGCGKTTLLRMTAGLEKITKGEVAIGGERMNGVHPRDRDIAMVFQSYALYPQMSVYDNIAFGLQVRGIDKETIKKRVKWAAGILALEPYLDRKPAALSGGQRQRVAMGRSIVREPKVFLFDEPLSNLDAKLRGQMRYEIRQLHDRVNATTIYVTHDQIEAMTMADIIVVMRSGEIMQMGSPDEVYDRPANLFVADFIGSPSINLMAGETAAEGVRFGKTVLPVSGSVQPGRKVVYGVRPVDIGVGEANEPGSVPATVLLSETTGAETVVHVNVEDSEVRIVIPERRRFERDAQVGLKIDPAKTHLFDPESEQRIEPNASKAA
ncbi:ABC transporter ATP-binding protein [Jiella marina]|uniref:ABC transporter ATP-binding protein n=1 Tax=Jiella sp. LLJ827 TaxID=2917712 RepID=UPI002100C085|nr:sn-glycerol-3-phosphate ABC transporter ATP-binding protein UgpC [Jiella sp. LLJ827]